LLEDVGGYKEVPANYSRLLRFEVDPYVDQEIANVMFGLSTL
jgi:hypothetical protein